MALVTLDRVTGGLASFYDGIMDGMLFEARRSSIEIDVRLIEERTFDLMQFHDQSGPICAACSLLVLTRRKTSVKPSFPVRIPTVLVNGVDPLMRFDSVAPSNFWRLPSRKNPLGCRASLTALCHLEATLDNTTAASRILCCRHGNPRCKGRGLRVGSANT